MAQIIPVPADENGDVEMTVLPDVRRNYDYRYIMQHPDLEYSGWLGVGEKVENVKARIAEHGPRSVKYLLYDHRANPPQPMPFQSNKTFGMAEFLGVRAPYDHVIACTGWRSDWSMFKQTEMKPKLLPPGKYPELTAEYESVNVKGLYLIGALAHGRDWRKSSGGFVHGFRYTIQSLFHMFERRHNDQAWPHVSIPFDPFEMTQQVIYRLSTVSSYYQMFGQLGDVLVLPPLSLFSAQHPELIRDVMAVLSGDVRNLSPALQANDVMRDSLSMRYHRLFSHYLSQTTVPNATLYHNIFLHGIGSTSSKFFEAGTRYVRRYR